MASKLGMSSKMLQTAMKASYGDEKVDKYKLSDTSQKKRMQKKSNMTKIQKAKVSMQKNTVIDKFQIGDSVMVLPDNKIGIVCQKVNEKGILRVQLQSKKIWINHKRVKLHVPASQLYPEGYDFSTVFDSVVQRKIRHNMNRKYTEDILSYDEDDKSLE